MSELEVRIARLEPMRVASSHGFGEGPEGIAWEKILAFADAKGLRSAPGVRYFGFNNPDPAPGSPNYGYEQWMTIKPDVQAEGEIEVKDFGGGLYAVTRCKLPQIVETWQQFVRWLEGNGQYKWGCHQWLEEAITPAGTPYEDMILDLYLPIKE